jgi:hypothetical protein
MEETQKLYGQIISGNNSGPVATTFPARNSNAQEALELLHSVQYRLAGLQEELRRATELLNSFKYLKFPLSRTQPLHGLRVL